MEKINFNDLPNTDTPINSSNLNKLQNNVENEIKSKTGITTFRINDYLRNGWDTNAVNNIWIDKDGVKHLQLAIRGGTDPLLCVLPTALRPNGTVVIPIFNYFSIGYAIILATGEVTAYGDAYVSGGNIIINISYI